MQLSVPHYFAEYTVRGANLDTLWLPLTNAPYLLERLGAAASEPTEAAQRAIVVSLTEWSDPGPGGFYDDLGNPEQSPHLVTPVSWDEDPDVRFVRFTLTDCVIHTSPLGLTLRYRSTTLIQAKTVRW